MKNIAIIFVTWLGISGLLFQLPAGAAGLVILRPQAQAALQQGDYPYLSQVEPILKQVSQLRQLPVNQPVQVELLNKQQLQAKLKEQMHLTVSPQQIEGEKALYVRWQMLPADFPYQQFWLDLYTEQIGGFYDPATQAFYLIQGVPMGPIEAEMLLAHELTHALQDQSYQLDQMLEGASENQDSMLARMALVEGDATATAMAYLTRKMQQSPDFWGMFTSLVNYMQTQQNFEQFQKAPEFLKNALLFPYVQGQTFIEHLQTAGWDWQKIGKAFAAPPVSSEQILHPDKYIAQEAVLSLTCGSSKAPGESLLTGVLGEVSFQQLLAHHFPVEQADQAAAGWNGDCVQVRRDRNRYVFEIKTAWDSPNDATEFFLAYQELIKKRYPEAKMLNASPSQKRFLVSPDDTVVLSRTEQQVLIAEGMTAREAESGNTIGGR